MPLYFLSLLFLFGCATTEEVLKDTAPHGTHANIDIKIYEYSRSPGISIGKGYFYPDDKKNNDYFGIKTLITNKTENVLEFAEFPVVFLNDDETKPISVFFHDRCCTAKDLFLGIPAALPFRTDPSQPYRVLLSPNEHYKRKFYFPYPKDAKPGKFLFKFKDVDGNFFEVMTIYNGEVQKQKAY